jgi:hypothetical protein
MEQTESVVFLQRVVLLLLREREGDEVVNKISPSDLINPALSPS